MGIGKNMVFNAKVKVGEKWEYKGTVVIRANLKGGVLYLRTAEKDANGEAIQQEIALFPRRDKQDGPSTTPTATAA